jgi:signal transduction histidine kinase/CheY-like chemotaxis protein
MWLGTDRGVDRFDGRSWAHFDKTDGLIWNDCDGYAFLADPDGSVWIGTSRGLTHYYAAGAPARPAAAPIVITGLRLGTADVAPATEISAPYSMRSFHATFAALTFVNEESTRKRYRLLGLDPTWTETENDDAWFPGLAPGRYRFEVQATAQPGRWAGKPAGFSFAIRPPWWRTWWAFAADAVLCCLAGRRVWKWRLRSILNKQVALERAVEERTRALTEQKGEIERLFVQAQESARLKSEFLANISHEIRTPMNGILGMTDLVLRTPLAGEQAECLRLVKVSADSLLSVINDVLDFSKIEAGKFDLDAVEFNPAGLLRDVVKSMEVLATNRRLTLRSHAHRAIPERVVGDPVRLRQVLINLIGNAIKFTERGGVEVDMEVGVGRGDRIELRFTVRDTGIGIPEEQQELIFEPFRQADGSTSRRYGGTGLGLAICARLVALMEGSIRVQSRPGGGSAFSFTTMVGQAVQQPAGAAASEEPNAKAPKRSLRVLVAEDNAVNRKLASRILENAGHSVLCANDGCEAVDAYARERFDIVLMDVQMPRMDGFEATREIRKLEAARSIHTPVLALTANAMKGDRERCLEAGMDGYLPKPLRPAELIGLIAELTAEL